MPLFRSSAAGVRAETLAGTLALRITEQFRAVHGWTPSESEQRSWDRSLAVLSQDLVDAGLGEVEVLCEMQLPLSSSRMDAVLAGTHPRTGQPSYVVVELKQWTDAGPVDGAPDLCTVAGFGRRPVLHPVEQVRRYCTFLTDFARALDGREDAVVGAAYLHNATDRGVDVLFDLPQDARGRLFTGQRRGEFLRFLRERWHRSRGRRPPTC